MQASAATKLKTICPSFLQDSCSFKYNDWESPRRRKLGAPQTMIWLHPHLAQKLRVNVESPTHRRLKMPPTDFDKNKPKIYKVAFGKYSHQHKGNSKRLQSDLTMMMMPAVLFIWNSTQHPNRNLEPDWWSDWSKTACIFVGPQSAARKRFRRGDWTKLFRNEPHWQCPIESILAWS